MIETIRREPRFLSLSILEKENLFSPFGNTVVQQYVTTDAENCTTLFP
jgi:hypothetical protein